MIFAEQAPRFARRRSAPLRSAPLRSPRRFALLQLGDRPKRILTLLKLVASGTRLPNEHGARLRSPLQLQRHHLLFPQSSVRETSIGASSESQKRRIRRFQRDIGPLIKSDQPTDQRQDSTLAAVLGEPPTLYSSHCNLLNCCSSMRTRQQTQRFFSTHSVSWSKSFELRCASQHQTMAQFSLGCSKKSCCSSRSTQRTRPRLQHLRYMPSWSWSTIARTTRSRGLPSNRRETWCILALGWSIDSSCP